jgi:hypothetical protein
MKTLLQIGTYYVREYTPTCRFLKIIDSTFGVYSQQQNIIGIHVFDSRLYLDIWRSFKWKESFIFRYFKVCQVSQMFTCGLSDLLSCDRFVGCSCIARILVSSEHKLWLIWNTSIVSVVYFLLIVAYLVFCILKR